MKNILLCVLLTFFATIMYCDSVKYLDISKTMMYLTLAPPSATPDEVYYIVGVNLTSGQIVSNEQMSFFFPSSNGMYTLPNDTGSLYINGGYGSDGEKMSSGGLKYDIKSKQIKKDLINTKCATFSPIWNADKQEIWSIFNSIADVPFSIWQNITVFSVKNGFTAKQVGSYNYAGAPGIPPESAFKCAVPRGWAAIDTNTKYMYVIVGYHALALSYAINGQLVYIGDQYFDGPHALVYGGRYFGKDGFALAIDTVNGGFWIVYKDLSNGKVIPYKNMSKYFSSQKKYFFARAHWIVDTQSNGYRYCLLVGENDVSDAPPKYEIYVFGSSSPNEFNLITRIPVGRSYNYNGNVDMYPVQV